MFNMNMMLSSSTKKYLVYFCNKMDLHIYTVFYNRWFLSHCIPPMHHILYSLDNGYTVPVLYSYSADRVVMQYSIVLVLYTYPNMKLIPINIQCLSYSHSWNPGVDASSHCSAKISWSVVELHVMLGFLEICRWIHYIAHLSFMVLTYPSLSLCLLFFFTWKWQFSWCMVISNKLS